jgi:hypothetical protein
MDEITMFTAIRPAPPADAGPGAPRARIRLEEAFGAVGGRRRDSGRMPAGPGRMPAGAGRMPAGAGRFRFRRSALLAGADPAAYTGPLAASDPVNQTTVRGCFYPATGASLEPAPVQQAVVTQVATPAGTGVTALYDIHPAAMPPGSVLLIQGAAIGGPGPRAAAGVSELASFPAPAVLTGNSLPPSCTWRVIARFPFRLLSRGSVKK